MTVVKRGDLNLTPLQWMNPEIEVIHKKIRDVILPTVGPYSSQTQTERQLGQQQLVELHNIFLEETGTNVGSPDREPPDQRDVPPKSRAASSELPGLLTWVRGSLQECG